MRGIVMAEVGELDLLLDEDVRYGNKLNSSWSGRWINVQKRKYFQTQYTLKAKIEGLNELL